MYKFDAMYVIFTLVVVFLYLAIGRGTTVWGHRSAAEKQELGERFRVCAEFA